MKKVLFATTALVASAGIAAADIKMTGFAEMGIVGSDSMDTQFHTDMDVSFHLSGETDGGLTFGAKIDLDEVAGGIPTGYGNGGVRQAVWIGGSWGKVTLGDTDGAFDWAMKEAIIGSTIDDTHEHAGYNSNALLDVAYGGEILRYDNSFGAFGVAASVAVDDVAGGDAMIGLGVKYATDLGGMKVGFGLGFQGDGTTDILGASVDVKTDSGITGILNYSTIDDIDYNHIGLAVGYTMDALTVGVNWGQHDIAGTKIDGIGLAVNYSLGGGATVQLGYASDDVEDAFSLGLAMKF
ncbi:MAG: porin [Marinosulfonomonas sp.]|nr:porin [Marinosulfonomonas sp.]